VITLDADPGTSAVMASAAVQGQIFAGRGPGRKPENLRN